MQYTSIEWADYSWGPTRGCSRISDGCRSCYAEKTAARFSGPGQAFHGFAEFRIIGGKREAHWTGNIELIEDKLLEPHSWKQKALNFAKKNGRRPRCFVNSMSDLFHEALPDEAIDCVLAVMALCPEIDFIVLTKRAYRMERYFEDDARSRIERRHDKLYPEQWPLPNLWLGVSVEDQPRAYERVPHLLRTPAAVRLLSVEPLLGSLNLPLKWMSCLDWVIVGGESGPGARPMTPDWVRSIRDQCRAAGVPFHFKQWGEHNAEMVKVGKHNAGRLLDGVLHDEYPEVRKQ